MRTKEDFDTLLRSIHNCKSLTVIEYTIDANLSQGDLSAEQKELLTKIKEHNVLDEVWLLTAGHLGLEREAANIRAFLERKKQTPALDPDDDIFPEEPVWPARPKPLPRFEFEKYPKQ